MITSQQREFLSEILEGKPIPEDKLVYFRERLRDRLHSTLLAAFQERAKAGLKQCDLAERIHKKRAQITRWFSTTSNLTLYSISDLMVGLGMDFDGFPFTPIERTLEPKEPQASREEWAADVLSASTTTNTGEDLVLYDQRQINASSITPKEWLQGSSVGAPFARDRAILGPIESLQKQASYPDIDYLDKINSFGRSSKLSELQPPGAA